MKVSLPAYKFDYFQNCVHCGLCLPTCPTYSELGDENDSPRGRIYLMQALVEGRVAPSIRTQHHLDLCLDCRACETICPSGVHYGALIESIRTAAGSKQFKPMGWLNRFIEWFVLKIFPYPRRTRWLLRLVNLAGAVGFFEFSESLSPPRQWSAHLKFPQVLAQVPLPDEQLPANAVPPGHKPQAKVAMFLGCVSESILGATNRATHRVLLRNNCEVSCPAEQVCCGAIHYHAGKMEQALRLARANIDAFESRNGNIEAIVVNVAGCGLMLKEYAELLRDDPDYAGRAKAFVSKIKDINQFLAELPLAEPDLPLRARVTYHEACHLCHGQRISSEPRKLLRAIPGLELAELRESDWCCGAAGTYNLTQPEMAGRLAERKLSHIDRTGAEIVAVANAGCILHLRQHAALTGRKYHIVHPIDLLDQAYNHE